MRQSGGGSAPEFGGRGEEQAETAEARGEVQPVRDADEAGSIPTGRPMDPLLRQRLLWLRRLSGSVSL